jgi:hypothetical protein
VGNIFLLFKTPGHVLGPIQPLVCWVPSWGGGGRGGFLWLNRPVRELDLLPSTVLRVRMSGVIPLFPPVCLCITRGENVYNEVPVICVRNGKRGEVIAFQ